jgi:hypothetical protein
MPSKEIYAILTTDRAARFLLPSSPTFKIWTYLVSVSPEEVLGADVHERVFGALLERGHVGDVLPVVVPQTPGVDAGNAEGGNDDAVRGQFG